MLYPSGEMNMKFKWVALMSAVANPILLYLAYKITQQTSNKRPDQHTEQTEVLFFPDEGLQCPRLNSRRGCLDSKCRSKHTPQSLARLEEILKSATKSCDVCMFVIASQQLIDILVELHLRGVHVRCIADNQDMDGVLHALRSNGILVKFDKSDYLMHHKFVVIDSKIVLTGSYNFSRGGMGINRENIVKVSYPHIVDAYVNEFNEMWRIYGKTNFSINFRKDLVYEG